MESKNRLAVTAGIVALVTLVAGCAGTPSRLMADEMQARSTSRVTVIDADELVHAQSIGDALRLHPAVDVTGR